MSIGLAVMRLQPLHKGHQRIIGTMLAENDKVYLGIGSPNRIDNDNPFTYRARRRMVTELYKNEIESGKLVVMPVDDIYDRKRWAEHVLSLCDELPDAYYSGSGQDGELFAEAGLTAKIFDRSEMPISATDVRKGLWNAQWDESWQELVPAKLVSVIEDFYPRPQIEKKRADMSSPLFCDAYHLTMPQAIFNKGTHLREETYEAIIRNEPFGGAFAVSAGLGEVLEWLDKWKFSADDIEYLRGLKNQNPPLNFTEPFLEMLKNSKLSVTVEAIAEGELLFPNEPIYRVTGPAWQAMIVEAGILQILNSQSLIATEASRMRLAADCDGKKRPVLELGLRRAQDFMGMSATRAAYIGGADATSNMQAGKYYDIPVAGTMAHCFIMRELDETEAFKDFLCAHPDNSTLLIDTYDTLQGARNAIKASQEVGIPVRGVRLDSGDLGYLSKEVRKLFDAAGMKNTKIVVSNDLDEHTIKSLILEQQAPIDMIGVGTKLVTAYAQPALGGVYKLKESGGLPVMKLSENPIKSTIPGATDFLRIVGEDGKFKGDVVYCRGDSLIDKEGGLTQGIISVNLSNQYAKVFEQGAKAYKPMVSAMIKGKVNPLIRDRSLRSIRAATLENLSKLDASHLRLLNPHEYVAGLEHKLYDKRRDMSANIKHNLDTLRGRN